VVESDRGVEPPGDIAVLAGEVDADDIAPDVIGEEACRAADTAACIEHAIPLR
jgi:hypothetical protein